MGLNINHAVIATTYNRYEVERIRGFVEGLPEMKTLFLFSEEERNGTTTVVMVPDGSLEGWELSDAGNKLRDLFISELEKAKHEDGSNPWKFVEVEFGDFGQKVLRGNCQNLCDNPE